MAKKKTTTSTSLPPEMDALLDELTQKLLASKDLGSGHQLAMAASTELMKHLHQASHVQEPTSACLTPFDSAILELHSHGHSSKAIAEHLKVAHQYEASVATIRKVIQSHQKKA